MSHKSQSDAQKHFAVGRGLLAAAETLNFSMNEQRQMGGVRVGGGDGMEAQDGSASMSQRGGGGSLGSTMKLFASLGLSAADLDALAQIPEDEISVETLPRIIMQLKSRKAEAAEERVPPMSDAACRGGGDSWNEGRMGGSSLGQSLPRSQLSTDFGFGSLQEASSNRSYGLNYGNSADAGRERPFSSLSHQESYGGLGMRSPPADSAFMQRRIGSPSVGKVQDFLGVMPSMYPHVCALCDFDVHSSMEWNQHTNGLRHDENRRLLLDMYPEWDPSVSPSRGGFMEGPNRSTSLLGPGPISSVGLGGMGSNWGGDGPSMSGNLQMDSSKRTRVVVVKYDRKPLSNKTLFAFAESFGVLREHLVLKNKAFLEMRTPDEAEDMVNYYDQHPASLYGKPLVFYLSRRLQAIQKPGRGMESSMEHEMDHPMDRPMDRRVNQPMDRGVNRPMDRGVNRPMDRGADRPLRDFKGHNSKVVFFSNLPREDEDKKELLTIARRFGTVEKHLFLTDQAFVQLGTVKDAEMLVKYYTANPLNVKGRMIRLNICAKYKTLNVKKRGVDLTGDAQRSGRNSKGRPSSTSSTPTSPRSTTTRSKSKEERKEEEVEEEAVEGVIQGGEEDEKEEEEAADEGAEKEEGLEAELTSEDTEKEEAAPSHTGDALGDAGEADDDVIPQAEPTEVEAPSNETEGQDEAAAKSSELAGDDDEEMDQDFMENMEDFVTLDELQDEEDKEESDIDKTKKGGMRVVNIVGLRRGHNFLNELLGLAKPFGNVVRHLLLDLKPEAFLQFSTEDEARAMTKFYNGNVTALVCGRPVRVIHSMSYPTIQCGSSRVVYIGQIPLSNYSDESLLKLAEPYGKIRKYFLNRFKKECFIEMESPEEAEKMADEFKFKPLKFNGKRLTIYVCRKYRQLKHGHRVPINMKRSKSPPTPKSSKLSDEPVNKKPKEELRVEQKASGDESKAEGQAEEASAEKVADVCEQKKSSGDDVAELKEKQEVRVEERAEEESPQENGQTPPTSSAENKPDEVSLLPPYDPETPVGVEHVKIGYYCRICCLFYSNEEKAKKVHCSSKMHYDKLQKHLEKKKTA